MLPRPLKLPPATVTDAPLNEAVGGVSAADCGGVSSTPPIPPLPRDSCTSVLSNSGAWRSTPGSLDRPGVVAGNAEFDPEPVALCDQTAYCGRVVALEAEHVGQVGGQVLGADLAQASDKVECLLDMFAGG